MFSSFINNSIFRFFQRYMFFDNFNSCSDFVSPKNGEMIEITFIKISKLMIV